MSIGGVRHTYCIYTYTLYVYICLHNVCMRMYGVWMDWSSHIALSHAAKAGQASPSQCGKHIHTMYRRRRRHNRLRCRLSSLKYTAPCVSKSKRQNTHTQKLIIPRTGELYGIVLYTQHIAHNV